MLNNMVVQIRRLRSWLRKLWEEFPKLYGEHSVVFTTKFFVN